MIVIVKQVPLAVVRAAILEDIRLHRTSSATRGMVLLPEIEGNILTPEVSRIALEYQNGELMPTNLELMAGNILGDVAALPKSTRIPYTLFMYSELFHHSHREQLQFGPTAYALIQKLTTVRK